MEKMHIEANTVQETLVIPLFARREASRLYPEIFSDTTAAELMEKIDYDFSGMEEKSRMYVEFGALEVAMRQYDSAFEVREYMKDHPECTVVNLGCGLDNTFRTVYNGKCRGVNVDFPDVISVREQLLPCGEGEINLGTDINDLSWLEKIDFDRERGIIFFAQGVFYYFLEEQVRALFSAMAKRFPGGRIVFDTANKKACKMMTKTWIKDAGISDVSALFYVENVESLKAFSPDIRAVSSRGYMTGYDMQKYVKKGWYRFLSRVGDNMMKMQIAGVDF